VEAGPSGADLFIRAGLIGEALRIEVENTGHLIDPRPGSMQIGLTNARERLRILYGERASLQLGARSEGRVTATILIPTTA
jgi:LytS/YehU family sensor histidine kinase